MPLGTAEHQGVTGMKCSGECSVRGWPVCKHWMDGYHDCYGIALPAGGSGQALRTATFFPSPTPELVPDPASSPLRITPQALMLFVEPASHASPQQALSLCLPEHLS